MEKTPNTAKFSLYVSPYIVANQGGRYTKHIYIGSQRVVSKIGDFDSYGSDPRRIQYAGSKTDGLSVDYKQKYVQQLQAIKDNYATFAVPYNGEDNNDYVDGKGFCCNDGSLEAAQARALARAAKNNFQEGDAYEKMQFYYHPDHLGSSSYITNLNGEVVQHIEYVPFGEVFVEERNNIWNTPYLFNAKEFDEETGLYYYGARYYDPRLSLWISVDPLSIFDPHNEENYIEGEHNGGVFNNNNLNSYSYCYQNPIILTDPNGKQVFFNDYINKLKRQIAKSVSKATERICIYAIKEASDIAKAYVANRLNNVIEKGEPKRTSLALTTEFITGLGPENRNFNSSHPFTQSLKESNMTTVALKAYYKGYKDYVNGKRSSLPTSYRVDFGLLGYFGGDTGLVQEFVADGKFTASQFVGTANYKFELDSKNNLHVTVYDTKTEYSFLYHAPKTDRHSRKENKFMGETKQTYHFVVTLQELKQRAEK